MPRAPRPRPPAPDDRQAALPLPAARRKPPTPEQIAQVVRAKLKSPVGMPDRAELPLKIVLPRAVVERLMVRAHSGELPESGGVGAGGVGAGGEGVGLRWRDQRCRRR
jgi:hypothetical protein